MFTDKVAHYILYAGLGWIFVQLEKRQGAKGWKLVLAACVLAAVVGLSDEFYQGFVPNRTREIGDWIADVAGGGSGAIVALGLSRNRRSVLSGPEGKERAG